MSTFGEIWVEVISDIFLYYSCNFSLSLKLYFKNLKKQYLFIIENIEYWKTTEKKIKVTNKTHVQRYLILTIWCIAFQIFFPKHI